MDEKVTNWFSRGVRIRTAAIVRTPATVLTDGVYYDGCEILACEKGRFQFDFDDGTSTEIASGEILVIYPGVRVTVRSLAPQNQLDYVILSHGQLAADFFNSFAFYDRLRFAANVQTSTFSQIVQSVNAGTDSESQRALDLFFDVLTTFQHDLRRNGAGPFFDAVRTIHNNLSKGVVRSDEVCKLLSISRSHLHTLFLRHCQMAPGEFIRREQVRIAVWKLTNTNDTAKEIAASVGIPSAVYFSTFIRRMIGKSPKEIRRSGL